MIMILIWLLIAIVLMWVAYLLAMKFIADSTLRTIVLLILGLIFLLIILSQFGLIPNLGVH